MEKIKKYKNALLVLCGLTTTIHLTIIFMVRSGIIQSGKITQWEIAGLFLPGIIAIGTFLPLMYLYWFDRKKKNIFHSIQNIFYWVFVSGFVLIVSLFVWNFMFT